MVGYEGSGAAVRTLDLLVISLSIKSNTLPDLWVLNPTCWYRPIASVVSLKIAESVSSESLTCKVKSPMKILFWCSGRLVET